MERRRICVSRPVSLLRGAAPPFSPKVPSRMPIKEAHANDDDSAYAAVLMRMAVGILDSVPFASLAGMRCG